MKVLLLSLAGAILLLVVCSLPAAAAGKSAHIGYVFPAGGRQGSTVVVKIGGENVYGSKTALVSGSGVVAEVLDSRDPNEGQMDPKKKNRKKNEAALDEIISVKLTIAPDAEPGGRDLCLATTNEISNKLVFQVGQLPEVLEHEPNNKPAAATPIPALPVLVQGQILPGDVDVFRFKAMRGQHLVVDVAARALLPYIADGVPGWFQAIIALHDAGGRKLAVADDFRFNQDPVLLFDVPEDGDYTVSIRDTLYRGREDFVYRMRIGELPYITGVFPLGAQLASTPAKVSLSGVNLPCGVLPVAVDSREPTCLHLAVTNNGLLSNRALFAVGDIPELVESPPSLKASRARTVVPPVLVNGCLSAPGEKHYYRFRGKRDDRICVEVSARRLGSPLDSRVTLLNHRGAKLAENDDVKDRGEGFLTHQSDSALTATLPEEGAYMVVISDTQGRGGTDYSYRLYVGAPRQDFDLRLTPASVMMAQGGSAVSTIQAIRRNGFTGEIRLTLQDPSGDLTLEGGIIPAGFDKMTVTLTSGGRTSGHLAPQVFGMAVIEGKTVTRQAVAAENLMQAFLYQHLYPFHEETVLVTPARVPFALIPVVPTNGIVNLPVGRSVEIPVRVMRSPGYHGAVRLQLAEAPKGVTFGNTVIPPRKDSVMVAIKAESRTETNSQGNLVFTGTMQVDREATTEEVNRMAARAAREKESRDLAGVVTNAPAKAAGITNRMPEVATAASTNTPAKPVMVNRPVTLFAPAVAYRIIENPVLKQPDPKPAATPAGGKPKSR